VQVCLLSAIFNEVLQVFLIWLGCLIIPVVGLIEAGGWDGMVEKIRQRWPGDWVHMWSTTGAFDNPMGLQDDEDEVYGAERHHAARRGLREAEGGVHGAPGSPSLYKQKAAVHEGPRPPKRPVLPPV
jgi:hypothetical protein